MNYYGFAHPLRAFLAGKDVNYHRVAIDAGDMDQWLTDARSRIPYANQLCQLNLLGSHDTSRFLTLLGEDQALMRIALLVQFAYPGVPCIYYGDEIGMVGENDPYNRACFDWNADHWDSELRDFIRNLALLRQAHAALRRGAYQTLIADGDIFGFARFDVDSEGAEQLIVLVNRSARKTEIEIDLAALPSVGETVFRDLLTGLQYGADTDRLGLKVGAKGCLLLHRGGA
jgi:alpha-glucosidase